ncbi:MAG TPA: hypothetical protein VFK70_05740, partial [Vicinamibacteria bacterium]|nr:hypothetical protein [Vicinamibacteria bacterium]
SASASRLAAAGRWQIEYLTPVGALLAVVALARRAAGGRTPWPVVALWVLWGPLLALALAGASNFLQFPRHLQPSVPLLLYVMASEATALLESRPGRFALVAGLAVLAVPSLALDYGFAADPRTARLTSEDRWQYVTGWPSGYGLPEVSARLRRERLSRPLLVVRDTHWVPSSIGLDVYLRGVDVAQADVSGDPEAWADQIPSVLASGRAVYLAGETEREATVPVLDLAGVRAVPSVLQLPKPDSTLVLDLFEVAPVAADAGPAPDLGPDGADVPEAVTHARRGVAAALAGDHAEAATWLWRAYRLEPDTLTIRYDLGVVLAALRRRGAATQG